MRNDDVPAPTNENNRLPNFAQAIEIIGRDYQPMIY